MKKNGICFLLLSFLLSTATADNLDDLKGLELGSAKLPIYNQDRLQLMIYCNRARRRGPLLVGTDTVIDIIRNKVNIDRIRDGWDLKFYPLNAPLKEVMDFWRGRLYSEGIIRTDRADTDQEKRTATGSVPAFFRSPLLDLNGVGFECDFNRRTIQVRSEVKILLRMGSCDPRRLFAAGAKMPSKYEYITATCDSLLIDSKADRILLVGDVRIKEERSRIHCDRMTISLEKGSSETISGAESGHLKGVARINCDGNVKIFRPQTLAEIRRNGEERAYADHLLYEVKKGTITLTGDREFPKVRRGREEFSGKTIILYRLEKRAVAFGGCLVKMNRSAGGKASADAVMIESRIAQFVNDKNYVDFFYQVKVDDPRMTLCCDAMRVYLRQLPGSSQNLSENSGTLSGLSEFGSGGQRELDHIKCRGNVKVSSKEEAGNADGSDRSGREDFRNWLQRGENPFRFCAGKAAPALRKRTVKSTPETKPSTVLADKSDFRYRDNLLIFSGNVKVIDPRMLLDCTRMEILLTDQTPVRAVAKGKPSPGNKGLQKIVCTGKVHVQDGTRELFAERMILHFSPASAAGASGNSLFQRGGTELTRIECDNGVKMIDNETAQKGGSTPGLGAITGNGSHRTLTSKRGEIDFRTNQSHFYDEVTVEDSEGKLFCEEMTLFAAKSTTPKPVGRKKVKAKADPDAELDEDGIDSDPLSGAGAGGGTDDRKIRLNDDLELVRILCQRDVRLQRQTGKGIQRAAGTQADYVVSSGIIVLTGTAGEQPWMQDEGGSKAKGDRIVVDVSDGRMRVEGKTNLDLEI